MHSITRMTDVIGLRLAYRGLVAGLAAAWVWLATAMLLATLLARDPLAPATLLSAALLPDVRLGGPDRFVLALAVTQLAGGGIGLGFAYFFGRYFTVRATLALAAPSFALLLWLALGSPLRPELGTGIAFAVASIGYGAMLGQKLPLRGEVTRAPVRAARAG